MGDDNQRPAIFEQPVFQPLRHVKVNVVGRLVKEQHIALAAEYARERHTHLLPAGKFPHGLIQISKAQLREDGLRFIGGGGWVFPLPCGQVIQRSLRDGIVLAEHRCLRQICHGHAALDADFAVIGFFLPAEKAQEGGFTRAVAADNADAVALGDGQENVVHQLFFAVKDGYVAKRIGACHCSVPLVRGYSIIFGGFVQVFLRIVCAGGRQAVWSRPFGATKHSGWQDLLGGASVDAQSYCQGRSAACAFCWLFSLS